MLFLRGYLSVQISVCGFMIQIQRLAYILQYLIVTPAVQDIVTVLYQSIKVDTKKFSLILFSAGRHRRCFQRSELCDVRRISPRILQTIHVSLSDRTHKIMTRHSSAHTWSYPMYQRLLNICASNDKMSIEKAQSARMVAFRVC